MGKFTLKYRPEVMTLNDMCVFERPASYVEVRELLAKHIINGTGEYVEDAERAQKMVGAVPTKEAGKLLNQLYKQMNDYNRREIEADPN